MFKNDNIIIDKNEPISTSTKQAFIQLWRNCNGSFLSDVRAYDSAQKDNKNYD